MTTRTRLSLDEFLALPDIDERRLELLDGEVYEKVSPRWGHGNLAGELYVLLREHGYASVEPRAIIPASASMDASAPLPDLAFYRAQRPDVFDWMREPPDIAVEVLSPGQRRPEIRAKVDAYLAFGVQSVWVFDLERQSADVYEHGSRQTVTRNDAITTTVVPGLRIPLDDLLRSVGM